MGVSQSSRMSPKSLLSTVLKRVREYHDAKAGGHELGSAATGHTKKTKNEKPRTDPKPCAPETYSRAPFTYSSLGGGGGVVPCIEGRIPIQTYPLTLKPKTPKPKTLNSKP